LAGGDRGHGLLDLGEHAQPGHVTSLLEWWLTAIVDRRPEPGSVASCDTVLFETYGGAAGSVVVSQVSLGRKNRLWFSWDGATASYVFFEQELPDSLWLGGRIESRVVPRGPDTLSPSAWRRRWPARTVGRPGSAGSRGSGC
ncbi:MAG TPA: hypothetical protein VG276_31765, partial [Actinomycetes bacterium]|nr:hypothetical protein [Actinomycetes bacterium]